MVISIYEFCTIITKNSQNCLKQSFLYCFNPCTSLYFKTLKSHTKTLKIRPYMFGFPLKPSSGGPWPYFARLLNWKVDLHSWWRVSVCGCMSFRSVCVCVYVCVCVCVCTYLVETMSHTDTLFQECKSTFQFSNLAKYGHGPSEDGFRGDPNM
jgi:hypothetical protein